MMTKDLIVKRLKAFLEVSRGYMSFLRSDQVVAAATQTSTRGVARAFMFDSLVKSLILIVDEVLSQFEKASKEQIVRATYK